MIEAPKAENEAQRLNAVQNLGILDTPINPFFERITRITKAMFDVPIVAITIIDSERQWFKSTQGLNVCQNDINTSFCAHAILQNEVMVIPDATKDVRFADNPLVTSDPHIKFYAGCPIHTEDGFNVGTLCLIDSKSRSFNSENALQLKDMAALVQDELQKYKFKYTQSQMIEQLDRTKREKLIDNLTGVWNREGTLINIKEQILLSRQNKSQFLLCFVDVDDFKKINDTYGHNVGDDVLREVVKRLVLSLSESDIVGRWGGEEFIILKKVTDHPEKTANRIDFARSEVCKEPIISNGHALNASVTIGITIYDSSKDTTVEQLVGNADEALYEGKKTGKNCCVMHKSNV